MTTQTINVNSEMASSAMAGKIEASGLTVRRVEEDASVLVSMTQGVEPEVLGRALTEFVFSDWLLTYMDRRLLDEHPYLEVSEREYIGLLTQHSIRTSHEPLGGVSLAAWTIRVQDAFIESVNRDNTIQVDGVVRFRLRRFLTALEDVIHDAVEQFLADREYEEFVSMLRYMLDQQPATQHVLHVYCTDDRVWICDVEGGLLRDPEVSAAAYEASEDGAVNPEDLAMSILITRSPCKIVIHDLTTAPPWPSFAETLERVFLERATRCEDCDSCRRLKELKVDHNTNFQTRSAMPDSYE